MTDAILVALIFVMMLFLTWLGYCLGYFRGRERDK